MARELNPKTHSRDSLELELGSGAPLLYPIGGGGRKRRRAAPASRARRAVGKQRNRAGRGRCWLLTSCAERVLPRALRRQRGRPQGGSRHGAPQGGGRHHRARAAAGNREERKGRREDRA